MKPIRFFSILTLLLPLGVQAELKVVEDLGSTSALAYYRTLNLPTPRQSDTTRQRPAPRLKPYGEADMLPVHSPSLKPGQVTPRVHSIPGLRPLFLVGDDPLSRQWLLERGEVLRGLNAVGLVTNVQLLPALAELRRLGGGLDMAPVSADDLARRLGLQHYPVLVTATGLDQ